MDHLKTILVANRAEIATRILKTAKCDYSLYPYPYPYPYSFPSESELLLILLCPDLYIFGLLPFTQSPMLHLRMSHRQT